MRHFERSGRGTLGRIALMLSGVSLCGLIAIPVHADGSKGVKALIGPTAYYGGLVWGERYTSNKAISRGAVELGPAIQLMGMDNAKILGGGLLILGDHLLEHHKKTQWALRMGSGIGYGYLMVRASRVK